MTKPELTEEKRMNTVQYIGRRPMKDEDRDTYTLDHNVEEWGTGVRVTLSDGETVHEFPNWTIEREERRSMGSYSYALSGTGELHIIETFYAPGSMLAEVNGGKPRVTIVQTYSGHAWRNATGPVGSVEGESNAALPPRS
jgi:hypothetical protein